MGIKFVGDLNRQQLMRTREQMEKHQANAMITVLAYTIRTLSESALDGLRSLLGRKKTNHETGDRKLSPWEKMQNNGGLF